MIAKLNFIPILLQSLVSYYILLCWFDAQKHFFWALNDSNYSKLVQTFCLPVCTSSCNNNAQCIRQNQRFSFVMHENTYMCDQ